MNDIFLFVTCLKDSPPNFNTCILNYVFFNQNSTRSGSRNKLKHTSSSSSTVRFFYFNCLPLLWNSLPSLDLDQPPSIIKSQVRKYGNISNHTLTIKIHAHIITYVLVQYVIVSLTQLYSPSLTIMLFTVYHGS